MSNPDRPAFVSDKDLRKAVRRRANPVLHAKTESGNEAVRRVNTYAQTLADAVDPLDHPDEEQSDWRYLFAAIMLGVDPQTGRKPKKKK